MSVKQVTCPQCRAVMNVMANMMSVQCQSCGAVFSTQQPAAAQTSQPTTRKRPDEGENQPSERSSQYLIWTIFGGVAAIVFFAVLATMVTNFVGDGSAERAAAEQAELELEEARQQRVKDDVAPYVPQVEEGESYVEVKLPESTRKKIYRDHKAMIDSSFGKARGIPRSGKVGQSLRTTLGSVVEREIEGVTTIHEISKEDYANIVAEGDAKGW